MQAPALPANEKQRLEALRSYDILDTPSEKVFDDLAMLATAICQTPIAMVSLVDAKRQWFRSKIGISEAETPRDISFCGHAILQDDVFIVPDATADERFADNPLVKEKGVRFYAGAPLTTPDGQNLGTLCVLDEVPRQLTDDQKESLRSLARQVAVQLEVRLAAREVEKAVAASRDQADRPLSSTGLAQELREFAAQLAAINQQLRTEAVRRRAAQDALRVSEEKHRLVLETATDAVLLLDGKAIIRYANPAVEAVFGYAPQELVGKNFGMLRPERLRKTYEEALKRYLETGVRTLDWRASEMIGLRKDGREFPGEVSFNEVVLSGKHLFACFIRDLTERKCLEAQLQQAQKLEALGRMAGGVAHDFNNLITTFQGYVELAERHFNNPVDALGHLQEARRVAERASGLTRQLLAFSRMQKLAPRELELNAIVSDMEPILCRMAGETVTLEVNLAQGLEHIKADPTQLEQVLTNLVVNARDAMPNGGKISIGTEACNLASSELFSHGQSAPAGKYVKLSVSDVGCGMPKETISHIFEPFFTTKPPEKGTGLGLAMVYGIVKQSNGVIHVESTVGQGSQFEIYFPVVAAAALPATGDKESLRAAG